MLGLLHRSTGRTARFMDFIADQLIGLFAGRFYSMFTLPLTSRLDYSSLVLHRQLCRLLLGPRILHAQGLSGHTSPHGRRQLRRCSDLARFIGNSSELGHRQLRRVLLGARTSPVTPGTPRSSVLDHRQRHQGLLAPRCSVIAGNTITNDVGDSSFLGARSLPATSRTPRSLVLGHR